MSTQLGFFSRMWRLILGFLLMTWSIAGGPSWGYIGVYFLLSGSFGFSIISLIFKSKKETSNSPDF
jgi:hypothetical protein